MSWSAQAPAPASAGEQGSLGLLPASEPTARACRLGHPHSMHAAPQGHLGPASLRGLLRSVWTVAAAVISRTHHYRLPCHPTPLPCLAPLQAQCTLGSLALQAGNSFVPDSCSQWDLEVFTHPDSEGAARSSGRHILLPTSWLLDWAGWGAIPRVWPVASFCLEWPIL